MSFISGRSLGHASLLALSIGACWSVTPTAHACSRSPCTAPVRLLREPVIAGNLVYFEVLDDETGDLRLSLPDGTVIPADVRTIGNSTVFAPLEPIAAGSIVRLDYREYAYVPGYETSCDRPFSVTVTIGESAELIVRNAELRVAAEGFEPGAPSKTSWVSFQYVEPVGASGRHLRHVEAKLSGKTVLPDVDDGGGLLFNVRSACDGTVTESSCGDVRSVEPGEHELVIDTIVVGGPVVPQVRVRVDTSCNGKGGHLLGGAGSPDADAGVTVDDAGPGQAPGAPDASAPEVRAPDASARPAVAPNGLADAGSSRSDDATTTPVQTDAGTGLPTSTTTTTTSDPAGVGRADRHDGGCSTSKPVENAFSALLLLGLAVVSRRRLAWVASR